MRSGGKTKVEKATSDLAHLELAGTPDVVEPSNFPARNTVPAGEGEVALQYDLAALGPGGQAGGQANERNW